MQLCSRSLIFLAYIFASFLCPVGFYCPEGTGFDLRGCPEGTYGPDPGYWSVSQCRQCDGGHYCSSRNGTAVTGPCQEGYYCSHGNTSPQPISQATGTQTCLLETYCRFTHFGSSDGSTFLTNMWESCTVGCMILCGSGSPSEFLFWDGWWMAAVLCVSSGEGGPCPTGHYCPQAAVHPLPCPRGTFSNLTKLVSQVTVAQYHTHMSTWQWWREKFEKN